MDRAGGSTLSRSAAWRRLAGRRLFRLPLVVLGVVTLLFFTVQLAPGDPARLILRPGMTEADVVQVRSNYGLDGSIGEQYVRWVWSAVRGDLGTSHSARQPVAAVLGTLIPSTLLLVGTSLFFAFLIGITLGVWQARRAGRWTDRVANVVTIVLHSTPSFWLALALVLLLSFHAVQAGWPITFPASGTRSVNHEFMSGGGQLLDRLRHLVLPVATLTLVMVGGISRQVRSSVLEALGSEHVFAARARGEPEGRIFRRNVLRNALLPVWTLVGVYLPLMVSGTILVETVFGWPGMGRALVIAVGARDYPLILGISLVGSIAVLVGNTIADILYLKTDPRIRYE